MRFLPTRKVAYGLVSGVLTALLLKIGLDVEDPLVAALVPLVAGYGASWLVTDGPAREYAESDRTIEEEERASDAGAV